MSGVILDQDGQPLAGEARQHVAVHEQQAMATSQSGAIANGAGQLLNAILQLSMKKHPIEYIEFIKKMYDQERAYEAKLAFQSAMAKARAEFPPIKKTKHVGFKSKKQGAADTSYEHEELSNVINLTKPILGKYGLSTTFRATNDVNQPIAVTCIVTHDLGHVDDSNRLVAGKDESGNKNSIQGVKSTTTYLMRYTLLAALGIAAEGEDDDGRSAEAKNEPKITPESVAVIEQRIKALPKSHITNDTNALLKIYEIESFEDLPSSLYDDCLNRIAGAHKNREAAAAALKQAQAATEDANKIKSDAEHAARTTTPGGQGRMI